jgi:hypothetical protein
VKSTENESIETVMLTKPKDKGLADRVDAALRDTEMADAQDLDARPTDELAAQPVLPPTPEPEEPEVRMSQERRIAEWSDALRVTAEHDIPVLPPEMGVAEPVEPATSEDAPTRVRKRPPPPPGARPGRGTIPLMPDDDEPRRPDSEDALTPGMLVLGPPPATRGTTSSDDETKKR